MRPLFHTHFITPPPRLANTMSKNNHCCQKKDERPHLTMVPFSSSSTITFYYKRLLFTGSHISSHLAFHLFVLHFLIISSSSSASLIPHPHSYPPTRVSKCTCFSHSPLPHQTSIFILLLLSLFFLDHAQILIFPIIIILDCWQV